MKAATRTQSTGPRGSAIWPEAVKPDTPFVPAGMPADSSREDCQVRPCPLEIEAESVGEPYFVEGVWQVNIIPVKGGSFPGYYSRVDADRIEVDGMKLHIVRVMETHATTKPIFATDGQDALANAQDSCGDGPCEYVGTQDSETWTVTCHGKDVTDYA